MSDFTRINAPRVKKIKALLAMIHKSAHSQKADPDEVRGMLHDLAVFASIAGGPPAPAPAPSVALREMSARVAEWASVVAEIRAMTYTRAIQVASCIPDHRVGTVMAHLTDRLCKMAEINAGRES